MSIDTSSLDAMISALGWMLGLSCALVAFSILGFTTWWARVLESPSLLKLFGRSALAWIGIALLTFGLGAIAIGTESMAGHPFGPSSGGTILLAYLTGMRVATFELAISAALLQKHAVRTQSGPSLAIAALTSAMAAGAWFISLLLSIVALVVMLNMAAFTMGWTGP